MKEYILTPKTTEEVVAIYNVDNDLYLQSTTRLNTINAIIKAINDITSVELTKATLVELIRDAKVAAVTTNLGTGYYKLTVAKNNTYIKFTITSNVNEVEWKQI
jgi:predicted GNAT superfamily acetyltransferase